MIRKKARPKTVRSMTYNIIVKITVLKMCKTYGTPEKSFERINRAESEYIAHDEYLAHTHCR